MVTCGVDDGQLIWNLKVCEFLSVTKRVLSNVPSPEPGTPPGLYELRVLTPETLAGMFFGGGVLLETQSVLVSLSAELEPHASPGLSECERRNPKPPKVL